MSRYIYLIAYMVCIFSTSYPDDGNMESLRVNINNLTSLPLTVLDSVTGITYAIAAGNFISIEPLSYDATGRTLTIIGRQQYSSQGTHPLIIPVKGGDLNIKAITAGGETRLVLNKLTEQQ